MNKIRHEVSITHTGLSQFAAMLIGTTIKHITQV